jgi:hypothetical protein
MADERNTVMLEKCSWWIPVAVFVVAVLVNYPWELAQSPLYVGMGSLRQMWWHCFRASLGDGLLVLLIFATGWLVLRRWYWFVHPGAHGYFLMLVTGLVIGVIVEWTAVHVAERWAYTAEMPRVPRLCVGLVPVLQMLVLPPLIFRIVSAFTVGHSLSRQVPGEGGQTR